MHYRIFICPIEMKIPNAYGGERFKQIAQPFKDPVPGRKVLIVPPSEKVMKYFEENLDEWIQNTILEIKKHTFQDQLKFLKLKQRR